MSDMQRYPFSLAAGQAVQIVSTGSYCIVKESIGTVQIRATLAGGGEVRMSGLRDGQGFEGKRFQSILVTNDSGEANTGYILIADETFVDNRISGDVNVINGEQNRALAGGRLIGGPDAYEAAKYPYVQLWNPADSGKNLIVTRVEVSCSAAGDVYFYPQASALTTNQPSRLQNALAGAAAGVAQLRIQTSVSFPSPSNWRPLIVPANTPVTMFSESPLILPPGYGFVLVSNQLASRLVGYYSWFEADV